MVIRTLTGALAVKFLEERPFSFLEYNEHRVPTLLIMPHKRADFEAVMLSEGGAILPCPVMSSAVASHAFSMRGLPKHAVSVISEGEYCEIPIIDIESEKSCMYPVKCKQIYSKTVVFSGGMEHILYTDGAKIRTRIIEAPSEIDFSHELLCRLRVMGGLPDAVRSIAYRRVGKCWRMASTDKVLTLDSIVPLVGLAAHLGVCGEIRIICRGIEFPFRIEPRDRSVAYISADALFPN